MAAAARNIAARLGLAAAAALFFPPLAAVAVAAAAAAAGPAAGVETIVLIRHGEKPAQGLGQLDCRGLNRALRLPAVLGRLFGRPAAVFAPDPAHGRDEGGETYDYVRPLATVEPTAIAFGLPVNASVAVDDIATLQKELEADAYANSLVLVAWEHRQIVRLARRIMADHGGDAGTVPKWKGADFDGIYVIRLKRGAAGGATFERLTEGLDGQSGQCPQ